MGFHQKHYSYFNNKNNTSEVIISSIITSRRSIKRLYTTYFTNVVYRVKSANILTPATLATEEQEIYDSGDAEKPFLQLNPAMITYSHTRNQYTANSRKGKRQKQQGNRGLRSKKTKMATIYCKTKVKAKHKLETQKSHFLLLSRTKMGFSCL